MEAKKRHDPSLHDQRALNKRQEGRKHDIAKKPTRGSQAQERRRRRRQSGYVSRNAGKDKGVEVALLGLRKTEGGLRAVAERPGGGAGRAKLEGSDAGNGDRGTENSTARKSLT